MAYSAMAVPLILGGNLSGQVVYTDLDPDVVLNPEPACIPVPGEEFYCSDFLFYELDINADGNHDFGIMAQVAYWSIWPSNYNTNRMELFVYNDNFVGGNDGFVDLFTSSQNIGPGIDLTNSVNPWMAYWNFENVVAADGQFLDTEYQFAALRLKVGPNKYYGWLRVSVDSVADHITIHDYAYNASHLAPILAGATGGCYPPSVTGVSNITASAAKLLWAPNQEADKFQLWYRQVGVGGWTKINVPGNAKQRTITGLNCDATYEWKIRTKCGAEFSEFSSLQNFTTTSCKMDGHESDNAPAIIVFPNPATINITVFSQDDIESGTYTIADLNGRIVLSGTLTDTDINISSLQAGIYVISILSNGNTYFEKIIKQ
ncbi:MAG: T9SS type A sorting domain-containing protein [Bacteroidetes bacterium]|nr:T9SS type A sorting domain-containing protein [Bacteroidota bacterium]